MTGHGVKVGEIEEMSITHLHFVVTTVLKLQNVQEASDLLINCLLESMLAYSKPAERTRRRHNVALAHAPVLASFYSECISWPPDLNVSQFKTYHVLGNNGNIPVPDRCHMSVGISK